MSHKKPYRVALDPPEAPLAILTREAVDAAVRYARSSPRGRVIAPYHRSEADTLHRMLNAVQPSSYVRPHRHLDPPKAEAWIVLRGAVAFFTFDEDGAVTRCVRLTAGGERFGVDLLPGIYHSFVALEPDTVVYEVKDGPYQAASDKAFAAWAPAEGTPEAARFLQRLLEYAARSEPG